MKVEKKLTAKEIIQILEELEENGSIEPEDLFWDSPQEGEGALNAKIDFSKSDFISKEEANVMEGMANLRDALDKKYNRLLDEAATDSKVDEARIAYLKSHEICLLRSRSLTLQHQYGLGLGRAFLVDSEGGEEGLGEHVHIVYHFPDHDVYLMREAFYFSYHGIDYWQDWYEVTPKEVTITRYYPKVDEESV